LNSAGKLDPGSYRLLLEASGRGDSSEAGGGIEFNVAFAAAADVGAPVTPPVTGVPLPPALWSGGGLGAIIAIAAGARRALRHA
jgi:hypothetical protein